MITDKINHNGDGPGRLKKAFFCSMSGFKFVFQHEAAFRQELFLAIILTPCAFWLTDSLVRQLCLLGSLMLVLIVEIVNTAIEVVIDRISDEIHPLSKYAKDLGSAAVFLALTFAGLTWLLIGADELTVLRS
jgi:diacylglycerol kinase (ATP)